MKRGPLVQTITKLLYLIKPLTNIYCRSPGGSLRLQCLQLNYRSWYLAEAPESQSVVFPPTVLCQLAAVTSRWTRALCRAFSPCDRLGFSSRIPGFSWSHSFDPRSSPTAPCCHHRCTVFVSVASLTSHSRSAFQDELLSAGFHQMPPNIRS